MAKQNLPPIENQPSAVGLPPLNPRQEAAWNEVERMFRLSAAQPPAPLPGFAVRWQARLAAETARRQQYQTVWMFALTAALTLVILLLLAVLVALAWQSPAQFFFTLAYRLALVTDLLGTALSYLGAAFRALPPLSFTSLFFFNGFVTLLFVLWLTALQQLTSTRRVVK